MSQIQLLAAGPAPTDTRSDLSLPHVLLIVDCFPKTLGGGERIALKLAALLPQAGFRVSMLLFGIDPGCPFDPEDAPCPIYLLPLRNTYGLAAFRGAFALRRLLRDQHVKIVQTFFESSDLWGGSVVRLLSPAKLIWSRRDMGILRGRKHQIAYRLLRRLPHAVFAVSARVAEHVIGVDGVSAEKVRVIYNGLDLGSLEHEPACQASTRGTAPVITTIGNVRRVKGHDLLVEAAAIVLKEFPDVRFTVAGDVLDSVFYESLQARLKAHGIEDRFTFLGKISDLSRHLAGATIFALPSRSEGFSNALVEAMASGLPVVATDVGGNGEAVQDRQNGILIPAEDTKALADALLSLLRDPVQASRLGCAARHTVANHFTATAMLAQVAAAYHELLVQ